MKIDCLRGFFARKTAAFGLIFMSISWTAFSAGPGWYDNLDQALQVARQQNKPLFVDFSTSWCGVCKQMERTTLADPAVLSRLENFIKVKVDGDAFPQVCQAFGVEAYPTFVHLDSHGRILSKREGGMRVREMAGALDTTLRKVSANTAIAQARQPAAPQPSARQVAGAPANPQIANTSLLHAPGSIPQAQNQTAGREVASAPPPAREVQSAPGGNGGASLYNMTSDPLQGNTVYDTEAGNSARRSRFGGNNEGLKQLAEATAQPESAPAVADATAPATAPEPKDEPTPTTDQSPKTTARADAAPEEKSKPAASDEKPEAKTTARAEQPVQPRETTTLNPSPVVETRLVGLSSESLPRPLLSRSASGVTEKMAPAREVASVTEIRHIPSAVKASTASAPDSAKAKVPAPAEGKKKTEVASAAPARKISSSSRSETKPATPKVEEEKNSAGATKSDIERWMNEADSKLVEAHKTNNVQKKREARAMYNKVVEQDPENKFGKSDMAYVKMVSLIVDRDSDLLRRQAYTRIKEFETKFPDSSHKDYYTLIRAMLATDLDEITEARDLLSGYADKFPSSKYQQVAEETLKSLPSGKKVSSRSTKK